MEIKMLVFVSMECRTSREIYKCMSPLSQAISMNNILHLSFQVALWNTSHVLIFLQMEFYCAMYKRIIVLHIKEDCGENGLGVTMKLLVRNENTLTLRQIMLI